MFSYNKFLHFVFADETDSYFIESGTEIRFYSYLWYQLCKSGFEGTYFLEGTKQNLRLEILDATSFYAYHPKSFFQVFSRQRRYCKEERVQRVENLTKFYSWMFSQIKKGRQAFVVPLDTFCSLLEGPEMEKLLDKLIDLSGQKTQSILILTASMQSEETLKMLQGKVFRYCNTYGQPFCRELYNILYKKEQISFYKAVYEELGGEAVFLNVFNREQIRQLVYAAQYRQTKEFCPEIELEAIMDYIYYWCRSESMRDNEHILTDSFKWMRFADLYKQMSNETTWRKLRKAAANFHVSKKSGRIEKLYPDLQDRMGNFYCGKIGCYKELSRLVDSVELGRYKEYGGLRESVLQFEKFKNQIFIPNNWMICEEVETYVVRFLKELHNISEEGFCEADENDIIDAVSMVDKIIDALNFSRQYLWKNPDLEETEEIVAVCELYMQYLDISNSKNRCSRKRRQLKKRYDRMQESGDTDAELRLELENATKKEQLAESAEKEAEKQLRHYKTNLEEYHFETIREVMKKWETEAEERKKMPVFNEDEKEDDDFIQKSYDDDAVKRIAKMYD